MKEHHQTNDANSADPHDRLMDRALAEVVGGEVPPDLSASILTTITLVTPQPAATFEQSWTKIGWSILTIAATISIVATTVYLFSDRTAFRSASVSNELDRGGRMKEALLSQSGEKPAESSQVRALSSSQPEPAITRQYLAIKRYTAQASSNDPAIKGREVQLMTIDGPAAPLETPIPSLSTAKDKGVSLGYQWLSDSGPQDWKLGLQKQSQDGTTFAFRSDNDANNWGFPARDIRELERRAGFGIRPSSPGDQYTRIVENPFVKAVGGDAVSTFSIDVDTASYANVRQFLMDMRQLPPPDAVRIEELVNYFQYDYPPPSLAATDSVGGNVADPAPFAAHVEVASCPWAPEHRLVHIGIKGREIAREKRPKSNLVFLVDVSGSMDEPNKLTLVISGLRQLTRELGENDRVAIVVYASSEGLALESTRGDQQQTILTALDRLQAGGSTAGGAGIQLAYQIAEDHFIPGGSNRVVLCTDGDFNVGVTSTAELERLVAQKAKDTKVFLSVLGFGRGNLNDAMMQTIADRGNGNHHYVDNLREARKVLVEEMTGTLIAIAKDVKIQVEFNPAQVAAYRLIGYENRLLRIEDFNDDRKDAGEIGAGHTVTALYEVVPAGKPVDLPDVDELKYQRSEQSNTKTTDKNPAADGDASAADSSEELLTLKMRFKEPEGDVSRKLEWPVTDADTAFQDASTDFQFASAVAGFGLILRGSEYRGAATLDAVEEIAEGALGKDEHGYRTEFIAIVRQAKSLMPADVSNQDSIQQDATNQKE